MKGLNKDHIDHLLKISLASSDKVDEKLNQELKAKLRSQDSQEKSLSIWWLPMVISIFMTIVVSTIAFLYIPYGILKVGLVLFGVVTMMFSIILTAIGVRYYELKKGAVISL